MLRRTFAVSHSLASGHSTGCVDFVHSVVAGPDVADKNSVVFFPPDCGLVCFTTVWLVDAPHFVKVNFAAF